MKKFFILLSLCLLFTGSALAYEYTAPEACAYPLSWPGKSASFQAVACHTPHAAYYFSPEIAQDTRDALIDTQEKLFAALKEKNFTVYVFPETQAYGVKESRSLFLSPQEDGGISQAIALLQAVHGEFSNYGLIFGMADALCKEAGLTGYTLRFNEKGMLKFCNDENNLPHLLLYYPSFTEDFTVKTQIPFIKDLAVRFYGFVQEKETVSSLLSASPDDFQNAYIALMNEYVSSIKAETGLHAYLPPLRFAYGGESCPLLMQSAHGQWLLHPDFSDASLYTDWTGISAPYLYSTLWEAEDELKKIDDALSMRLDGLRFLLAPQDVLELSSNYAHYAGKGDIPLTSLTALSHEYAHACLALRHETPPSWFLAELGASFFELESGLSAHDHLYYTLLNLPAAQREYWLPVLEAVQAGKKLSWNSSAAQIYGYLCFEKEQYDLFTPASRNLNAIRAFSGFLLEIYGEKNVCRLLLTDDPLSVLGKSWENLQQEWIQYLHALYGDGSSL